MEREPAARSARRFAALAAGIALALCRDAPAARAESLRLVHAEDFGTASALDAGFWSAETGLFRNREAQYYTARNVAVRGGALTIEARRERVENAGFRPDARDWPADVRAADYTSASIVSRDAFTFGAFEVVARLPGGAGTWPAIWLVSEQGVPYREIDLVEAVGSAPGMAFSAVGAGPDLAGLRSWKAQTPLPTLAADFHAYRLDWRPHAVTLSIDGRPVLRMDPEEARAGDVDPLRASMRLRINLALGGSWGGRIDGASLPARLEIRSVRIWRLEG